MKTHFIIGGNGLVGNALRTVLQHRIHLSVHWSSRRLEFDSWQIDLEDSDLPTLPTADVVYLVAGMTGFARCEFMPISWRVNVDAPIQIAQHYQSRSPPLIVYISSDAVEKASGTAYARQKTHVEGFMRTINAAIIRPAYIAPERASEFAQFVVDVGERGRKGVFRWE